MPPTSVGGVSRYVTIHIHTDGPIPGPHSLLTLTSAAYTADGVPTGTFAANLRELPGATLHPTAHRTWRGRAEDWLSTRRAARPPGVVTSEYADWLDQLGVTALVTGPERPEHLFCYWYLQRFAGRWPFVATVPARELSARLLRVPLCDLPGCRDDTLALAAG